MPKRSSGRLAANSDSSCRATLPLDSRASAGAQLRVVVERLGAGALRPPRRPRAGEALVHAAAAVEHQHDLGAACRRARPRTRAGTGRPCRRPAPPAPAPPRAQRPAAAPREARSRGSSAAQALRQRAAPAAPTAAAAPAAAATAARRWSKLMQPPAPHRGSGGRTRSASAVGERVAARSPRHPSPKNSRARLLEEARAGRRASGAKRGCARDEAVDARARTAPRPPSRSRPRAARSKPRATAPRRRCAGKPRSARQAQRERPLPRAPPRQAEVDLRQVAEQQRDAPARIGEQARARGARCRSAAAARRAASRPGPRAATRPPAPAAPPSPARHRCAAPARAAGPSKRSCERRHLQRAHLARREEHLVVELQLSRPPLSELRSATRRSSSALPAAPARGSDVLVERQPVRHAAARTRRAATSPTL